MLAPETLDTIVEFLSGDFCASMGDDRCPEFVDVVIRQGLPMIYAASDDAAVTEVLCFQETCECQSFKPFSKVYHKSKVKKCRISKTIFSRLATPLWRGPAQPSSGSSE